MATKNKEEKKEKETKTPKEEVKTEKKETDEIDVHALLAENIKLEKEGEKAKKELEEQKEQYLRLFAEYDNFKKRTQREKEEIYFNSRCEILKKMLPVFDNLERAQSFSETEEFAEGVKMIIKQFLEVIGDLGIKEIEALNAPFDPLFHEAVFHDEKEGVPENTVTEVLQKGYAVGDKVIRHAMVKVSN